MNKSSEGKKKIQWVCIFIPCITKYFDDKVQKHTLNEAAYYKYWKAFINFSSDPRI